MVANDKPAGALFAFVADWYEKPASFDEIGSVLILPPKVINGDFQLFNNDLIFDTSPVYQIVSKAVFLGASKAFSDKGFVAVTNDLTPTNKIWSQVMKFTDAGMPQKRKMLPYFAPASKEFQFQNQNGEQNDAIVFFQIYGKFDGIVSSNQ